jgi:putative flippase GtrA
LLADFEKKLPDYPEVGCEILLVDDGSGEGYRELFLKACEQYGCVLVRHGVNLGKGRALKTAFNYFLNECPGFLGVVTLDSDGQHTVDDVMAVVRALQKNPERLILGCRDFSGREIPPKSKFGNVLTRNVLCFFCGVAVSDTQTGLRAVSRDYIKILMNVQGERYEYETKMLIECKPSNTEIEEVPIQTIYEDNNSGSHFNPIKDSIRIYAVFGKYILSSLFSFVVDIGLFTLFSYLFKPVWATYIFVATVVARVLSSVCNYLLHKKWVFQSKGGGETFVKYVVLVVCQMVASGILVSFLYAKWPLSETLSKMVVDTALFVVSFFIQRGLVFAAKKK